MNEAFDAGRRGVDQGPAGAFDDVGQHQYAGFFRLRLGTGVAERCLVDITGVGIVLEPLGLTAIEIFDERGAVVLLDEVDDRLRQMMLPGQVGSILDVSDDHQRAHGRLQRLVAVAFGTLVFDKIRRLEHLADVVEIGPDADEQAVGADGIGRGFRDRSDVDRMVVRARRASDELL